MTTARYGIFLAALDPTIGREIAKTRPVVIVSPDAMNHHSDTVVVCPLTTKLHPLWRSRIQIVCGGKPAEIAVDQIRTISKLRLINKLDVLEPSDAEKLRQTITELYA